MYPVLLTVGEHPVFAYGTFAMAAILLGISLAMYLARDSEDDRRVILWWGILVLPCGLAGSKLMTMASDPGHYLANPHDLLSFFVSRSAGVAYGGILSGGLLLFLLCRINGRRFGVTSDLCAPGVALGHVVWRVGCFLAGCCYGCRAAIPWAVVFTDPLAASLNGTPLGQRLHPTQLYEAIAVAVILVVMLRFRRRAHEPGTVTLLYFALYAVARFVIEPFRGDDRGMYLGGALSTSQVVSLAILVAAVTWLLYGRTGDRPGRSLKGTIRPGRNSPG